MAVGDPHRETMRRWLRGEIVNGHVGIRLRGEPWDNQVKIVRLDDRGKPPERWRRRSGREGWHLYLLTTAADGPPTWTYLHGGADGE